MSHAGLRPWLIGAGGMLALGALIAGAISAAIGAQPPAMGAMPGLADAVSLGADPSGVRDASPAFNRALGAKEIGKLVIPCGKYRLGATVTVPYGKTVEGFGDCSQLNPDAGITAFRLTGSTGGGSVTTMRGLRIWQIHQHPANVGILIDGGTAGMESWVLERVSVLGSAAAGEGKHSGTGIRSSFGLTGTIRDSIVQWWDTGIDFKPVAAPGGGQLFPNANLITGTKIRANRLGLKLVVQTAFLVGNTIEANFYGIDSETDSGLVIAIMANHFENLGRGGADLNHRGGRVASFGNTYAGVVERPTVIVGDGGAAATFGDVLTSGATAPPQRLRGFGSW